MRYFRLSKGLPAAEKTQVIADYKVNDQDTGSPEVQIALLNSRIKSLTTHAQRNPKDHHTRLGLQKMVQKQRRLLAYLEVEDFERYKAVVERLGLKRRDRRGR